MEEFTKDEGKLFKSHSTRLCMCECQKCANRSPHPIYNCYNVCETNEKLTEKEKLQFGLYRKYICTCSFCLTSEKNHLMDDCLVGCQSQTFRRL